MQKRKVFNDFWEFSKFPFAFGSWTSLDHSGCDVAPCVFTVS